MNLITVAWLVLALQEPNFDHPVFVSISDTPWTLDALGQRVEKQYQIPARRFLSSLAVFIPKAAGKAQPYKSARGTVFTPDGRFVANYIHVPPQVSPEVFMKRWIATATALGDSSKVTVTNSGTRYVALGPQNEVVGAAYLAKDVFWSGAEFNPAKRFPKVPRMVLGKEGLALSFDINAAVKTPTGRSLVRGVERSLNNAQQRRDQEDVGHYHARHLVSEIGREALKAVPLSSTLGGRLTLPQDSDIDARLLVELTKRRSKGSRTACRLRRWCDDGKALASAHCLVRVPPKSLRLLSSDELGAGEDAVEKIRNLVLALSKTRGFVDVAAKVEERGRALVACFAIGTGGQGDDATKVIRQQLSAEVSADSDWIEANIDGYHVLAKCRSDYAWFAVAKDRKVAEEKLRETLKKIPASENVPVPTMSASLDCAETRLLDAEFSESLIPSLTAPDRKAVAFSKLAGKLSLVGEDTKWRVTGSASDELIKLATVTAFRRLTASGSTP